MFWSDLGPKVAYEGIGIIDSTLPTVSVFAQNPSEATSNNSTGGVMPVVHAADLSDVRDDYAKGVVFYLQNQKIVGIVLWNIFNRINTARAILNQDEIHDDLNEVAKLFDIHA